MKNTKALIPVLITSILSACGGGGSTSPVAAPSPAVIVPVVVATATPSTALQTSVKAASYAAGSPEQVAFDRLNVERSQCGFGLLEQNTKLDQAAKAHVEYIKATGVYGHFEDKALNAALYTGVRPEDRILAAGYATATAYNTSEEGANRYHVANLGAADINVAVRGLLAAPYHLLGMMRPFPESGVGVTTKPAGQKSFDNTSWVFFNLGYATSPQNSGQVLT